MNSKLKQVISMRKEKIDMRAGLGNFRSESVAIENPRNSVFNNYNDISTGPFSYLADQFEK